METVSPAPETVMFTSPSYSSNKVMNDSWMITLIGTVPEAGGRGLATKLISLVLDRAKIEDTGVCVPTTYKPRVSQETSSAAVTFRNCLNSVTDMM